MSESVFNTQVYASVARKAQAEGIVMLENRDNALPLKKGSRIALFGRSQFRYYKSGTGSGGMVNTTYVTGVREAILEREAYVLAPSLEKPMKSGSRIILSTRDAAGEQSRGFRRKWNPQRNLCVQQPERRKPQ